MTLSYIFSLRVQELLWRHQKGKKPKKPKQIDKYVLSYKN